MTKKRKKSPPVVICPYCQEEAELVDDEVIYGRSFGGHAYLCRPCMAYVGCHKGTISPLGTPAKTRLLKMRHEGHLLFDRIWRAAIEHRGWPVSKARKEAYKWLANGLGIEMKHCHFGMFNDELARSALDFLNTYYEGIEKKKEGQLR